MKLHSDRIVEVDESDPCYQEQMGSAGVYSGQVDARSKFHGLGVLRSPECVSEGRWREGLLSGRGKQSWPDGRRYIGEFADGCFSGRGRMEWPHAQGFMVYTGEYRDDKKHGEGLFSWPSGKSYQGQWVQGRRGGYGVDISPTGVRTSGVWKDNQLVKKSTEPGNASPAPLAR